jgi:hypothetical protein
MVTIQLGSAKQVYETVREHLLAQGVKSVVADQSGINRCAYRGPDDLKCAVGCLIPDEAYHDYFENNSVYQLFNQGKLVFKIIDMDDDEEATRLLDQLQWIHDAHKPAEWEKILDEFKFEWSVKDVL